MQDRSETLEELTVELLYIAGDIYDQYLAGRLRAAAGRLMDLADTFRAACDDIG